MKRGIAKEEEMKLGKKTVVTIGVLLSALLCVNMILYTCLLYTSRFPASKCRRESNCGAPVVCGVELFANAPKNYAIIA